MTECIATRDGFHKYTVIVMSKAEFEPVSYGEDSEDTLYKRVDYVWLSCICSDSVKRKVKLEDE